MFVSLIYDAYKVQDKNLLPILCYIFKVSCFQYLTVLLYLEKSRTPNCQESKIMGLIQGTVPTIIGTLVGTYVQGTGSLVPKLSGRDNLAVLTLH